MFKYFRDKIDSYILRLSIKNNFDLTEPQKAFLKEHAKILQPIFQNQINAVVVTSLLAGTEEGLKKRNNWIDCLTAQIKMCDTKLINNIIEHPFTKKQYTKEEWAEYQKKVKEERRI